MPHEYYSGGPSDEVGRRRDPRALLDRWGVARGTSKWVMGLVCMLGILDQVGLLRQAIREEKSGTLWAV